MINMSYKSVYHVILICLLFLLFLSLFLTYILTRFIILLTSFSYVLGVTPVLFMG